MYPAADSRRAELRREARSLMGVRLQDADCVGAANRRPRPGASTTRPRPRPAAARSGRLLARPGRSPQSPATSSGLQLEYRRSVRRARALQDVLLPELDRTVYEIETRLEELEQEDAIWMRKGGTAG